VATGRPSAPLVALVVLALLVGACAPAASGRPISTAAGSTLAASGPGASLSGSPGTSLGPAGSPRACPASAASPVPALGQPGWWADRTFYEAFVRSFADSNGDGTGDLRGLISRLDYLNDGNPATTSDLGITGLWLMPILPSPSYHGYDVTDYRSVNAEYGSLSDLRMLVSEAHRRGIAVILDMPFNHTSSQDPWFIDSQKPGSAHADWYVWSATPGGSNWFPDGKRFYYAAFGPDLPDLNYRNPAVTAAIDAVAKFWLTDVGVDGFRLDAAKYIVEDGPVTQNTPETHAWLQAFRSTLATSDPGALLLGEVWDTSATSASYVPNDLNMTFDFGLSGAYVAAANGGQAWGLAGILNRVVSLYPSGGFGTFLTNHDMDRLATQVAGDPARMRLAASLLLTGPGVPFIYYGEEIGMSGAKPDERIRTPMRWDSSSAAAGFTSGTPWEALSADPSSVNVADETGNATSLLSHYRALVALRAAHPALNRGDTVVAQSSAGAVLATIRRTPAETLLVLANLGTAAVSGETVSLAAGPLCGTLSARVIFGGSQPAATLPPPIITSSGGLVPYTPVATLAPESVTVIALGP
jgi:glycosidase